MSKSFVLTVLIVLVSIVPAFSQVKKVFASGKNSVVLL